MGMPGTGIVIDPRYLEHDTGPGHPERGERIAVLLDWLQQPAAGLHPLAPRCASGDEIALVHDGAYVDEVAATRSLRSYAFDADTPVSAASYDTARLAAGGFLALLDAIMAGEVANGFAFVRPPGHHAERTRAMGFCLFNNIAIGAEYLRRTHKLSRVLIVDWDLHHGNGTQHMFDRDPGVLYVSTHQYPYYPGTGAMDEVGRGDGTGFTVNVPLPAGCGDAEFAEAFATLIEPIAHQFAPEFVLISAGFDAHHRDPLGGLEVTERGFDAMTRSLLNVAQQHAGGRCAAILEGGYDLTAIRSASATVLDGLRAAAGDVAPAPTSRAHALLDAVRRIHRQYWKF
jgi:acetoin utilization deacetylase AcuC-like enzyme